MRKLLRQKGTSLFWSGEAWTKDLSQAVDFMAQPHAARPTGTFPLEWYYNFPYRHYDFAVPVDPAVLRSRREIY